MTQLFIPAERVLLYCNLDGTPVNFSWRGKQHTVIEIIQRWRADTEWWRIRQWREHFTVATDTGLLLTIYHDLSHEGWYVQRRFN